VDQRARLADSQAGARLAGETALKALLREMAKNSERDRP
jgi:hypothetical protein